MTRQLSRREFLKRGVVVAGGAGLLGSSSRVWAAPRSDFGLASNLVPAVVIGSGFGGSVAALRLGLAGIDTVVLERGRRWPIRSDGNTFATFEQPDGRAYWLRDRTGEAILGLPQLEKRIDRYVGVLEVVEGNGIVIGAGAGVGGGSLVFNAIIVKPLRDLFERVFPRQIDFDEMEDVYYPRVKEIIRSADPRGHPGDGVLPLEPREPRPGKDGGIAHAPGRVGRGLGHRPRRDRGTDGGVRDRGPVVLRSQQRGQAQPRSQLPCPGEATGHVEVLPLHQAVAIERDAGRYVVTTIRLREDGTADGEPRRLLCKHLFLAAGSIGTTSLLVRARATRALALNDDVGLHWAANGDHPVTRGALPFTNAGTGGPAGHCILEDLDNPFGPTSLVELVLPPHINAALGAAGAPPYFANYAILGIPPAIGSFTYNAATDAVTLNWPGTDPGLASFLAAT